MALGPADRVLALVPLQHSVGFNSVMLGALSVEAELVLPQSQHPRAIVREVVESGVTFFPAPPLFFDWMHRFAEGRVGSLGRVRACVSVGDALPHATHRAFVETFGVALWQSYGASEAGPALLNQTGAHRGDTMALGRPYPEVQVELRDDQGHPVPDGAVGEIVVQSPAVGLGYLGSHDGASRIAGRQFFTGDLGIRRDGDVHFAGRRKLLITRAGRKVDPAEIERVLRTHPAVVDAAVRVAGTTGHAPLQALVVARRPLRAEELVTFCARALEPYKVPRVIEFRPGLPRDGAGKLQRHRLQTW
jgi:long-chain acyl-CoA synthetase